MSEAVIEKKPELEPIVWRVKTIPEARVRDKFQRDMCFNTLKCGTDYDKKIMWFDIACGGVPDHKVVEYTFEQVQEHFGWKGWSFELNGQTIIPEWKESSI